MSGKAKSQVSNYRKEKIQCGRCDAVPLACEDVMADQLLSLEAHQCRHRQDQRRNLLRGALRGRRHGCECRPQNSRPRTRSRLPQAGIGRDLAATRVYNIDADLQIRESSVAPVG